MRAHDGFLNQWEVRTALSLLAFISVGCGVVRHPDLEWAREVYERARQDPQVVRHAGVALDKAGRSLSQAEELWTKEKDVTEVGHLAYIAEKRVEIARVTAQRRTAAEEIQKLKSLP